jgi:long-chain acyl-CoA synthetase
LAAITDSYINHPPDKIAIQTLHEKITYQNWQVRVAQTANWLDSLELMNTKTVGVLLPNGIPFLQIFTGASAAGWTTVLFDIKWTATELQKRILLSSPSIFITSRALFPIVKHLHSRIMIWEECCNEIEQNTVVRTVEIDGKLPFYMGFTSGTTGEPKAFIRSHDSWLSSFDCTRYDFHINENDQVLIPGALIHSHFLYGVISTLSIGGTVILLEKFSPSLVLDFLTAEPITVMYLVPTMISTLVNENRRIEKPIKILASGAKWEDHSKQQMRSLFPRLNMYEFYGASELSFVTFLRDEEGNLKPQSVGKPCHNVEIQIRVGPSQLALPYETGKIFVKSNMVFIGYLDSKTVIDENGWMTVDDIGYLDEDGFLYISGREKNMILYGGINIFPEEVEKVLAEHPDVEEVAVIGIPDPHWGELVCAVIKGKPEKLELQRLCRNRLSSYKVPRKWVFIDEMPHTTSGKIARAQLKSLLESKVKSY